MNHHRKGYDLFLEDLSFGKFKKNCLICFDVVNLWEELVIRSTAGGEEDKTSGDRVLKESAIICQIDFIVVISSLFMLKYIYLDEIEEGTRPYNTSSKLLLANHFLTGSIPRGYVHFQQSREFFVRQVDGSTTLTEKDSSLYLFVCSIKSGAFVEDFLCCKELAESRFCSDLYVDQSVSMTHTSIGDPDTLVEIDESLLVKRKYNEGRILHQPWMFRDIERRVDGDRRYFIEFVDERT
ncbi:hypothetical protein RF11_12329 [Thelohanellus kitauei]|uniref:Uncharacterized protein n=1 Tax=Thelohanellus kitauei TaxID=669202 RepID=A0A0C2IJ43_THEKT|nr:hypothetical protein RF11_12329 [Thelohanellus kitauei]